MLQGKKYLNQTRFDMRANLFRKTFEQGRHNTLIRKISQGEWPFWTLNIFSNKTTTSMATQSNSGQIEPTLEPPRNKLKGTRMVTWGKISYHWTWFITRANSCFCRNLSKRIATPRCYYPSGNRSRPRCIPHPRNLITPLQSILARGEDGQLLEYLMKHNWLSSKALCSYASTRHAKTKPRPWSLGHDQPPREWGATEKGSVKWTKWGRNLETTRKK
jgi:hypothetical protein